MFRSSPLRGKERNPVGVDGHTIASGARYGAARVVDRGRSSSFDRPTRLNDADV